MLKLNLTNVETSDIKFEVSSFPDGQQDIVLTNLDDYIHLEDNEELQWGDDIKSYAVKILSRFNGFRDLELIIATKKALDRVGMGDEVTLYIPYLLGARSDRQFQDGGTSYLVDVVAPIINSLGFTEVQCLDVHSDVAAACIKNFRSKSNLQLVQYALMDIYIEDFRPLNECFTLLSPDAGASKKIEKLAKSINYTGDIITCSKARGLDGKLSNTQISWSNSSSNKDYIIVDDICDGGTTFLNIANAILSNFVGVDKPKIYLIVTHGIFSKGVDCMNVFERVYATNSIKDLGLDNMSPYGAKKHNIKQLNIF